MRVQSLRDCYKCHAPTTALLVLILMRMSKALRLGKYPSVMVLDISSVQFSTHEYAWMSLANFTEERGSFSAELSSF